MRIGDLNKRISIHRNSTTQDDYGQHIDTTELVCSCWASIEPLTGREFFAAEQVQSEISMKIRIRYRKDLLPSMVIFYGNRKFDVVSIIDYKEQHKELVLMCREVI